MEVSQLRQGLIMNYNVVSPSMKKSFEDYIISLDNMMLAVYGKMWDDEINDYT